jgi:carboxyl-terminal processing protease
MKKENENNEIQDKKIKRTTRKKTIKEEDNVIKKTVDFSLMEVIIIVLVTGIAISIASGVLIYNNYESENHALIMNDNGELSEFIENYNKILNNYVDEVDSKELIESAISGMYNYIGDEYTMYINDDDTSDLQEQLSGEYTGVGLEIKTELKDDKTTQVRVVRVFKDSPAEKSGIKSNDIITKLDGVEVNDANTLSTSIKKGNKETYEITYIRDGKENTLTLTREKVFINSVNSNVYDNVGYIQIETFSATTVKQIKECIDNFDKNVTSLVIDVRDNTGGYLDTAYGVSDLFIEKGKVIYQMKERNDKITKYEAQSGVYRRFKKIVVLINENSASASEILALALKESANATIVGMKSYGKGTVQETGMLSSGSMVKFTKAYWLSPNGNSINKVGITPDIEVSKVEKQKDEAIKAAK